MNRMADVAVIGAGIAGSSLAKDLADRGWETVLVDRQAFPRHKVCGEFLSPESQGMLDSLGLSGAVAGLRPRTLTSVRIVWRDGAALDIPLPGEALGVSRYALDVVLHQAAASSGVEVWTETGVTAIHPYADESYQLEMKQGDVGQSIRVRTVIAAWGGNPRLAFAGAPPHRERTADTAYVGVKTHYTGLELGPVVELYFFPGGYVGISPIEGGFVNVCALLKRQAFQSDTDKSVAGMLTAAAARSPALRRRLQQGVPVPGTQAAVAPVRLRERPQPWEPFARVGDASLIIPPLCGDGMSMALRSAGLCARLADAYLRGAATQQEWQRAYREAVRREFARPLRWGRLLHTVCDKPVLPRVVLALAQLMPDLAKGLVRATRLNLKD